MAKSYSHEKVQGVCLFTTNSKTGCPSWAISPKSCSGAKGCAVCKKCYGKKGRFGMPNVINALNQRYDWFNKTTPKQIVKTIVDELDHFGEPFFRTHVVGDFQNVRSIKIWNDIVKAASDVRFWFPTKAYRVKAMLPALRKLNKEQNVAVRPSAADFDDLAPSIQGLAEGATQYAKGSKVPENHFDCPGECKDCRVCWNQDTKVAYHFH